MKIHGPLSTARPVIASTWLSVSPDQAATVVPVAGRYRGEETGFRLAVAHDEWTLSGAAGSSYIHGTLFGRTSRLGGHGRTNVGFRIVHDDQGETRTSIGSNFELLPPGAARMEWDDEDPTTKDYNLSFRLTRDT